MPQVENLRYARSSTGFQPVPRMPQVENLRYGGQSRCMPQVENLRYAIYAVRLRR
jgi:hypothetical protein